MVGVAVIVIVLIVVPDRHQSLSYVFTETVNNSGFGDSVTGFSHLIFWFVFRTFGLLMSQYTIIRVRRVLPLGRGDGQRLSHGGGRDVHVGGRIRDRFGWILLLAVTAAIPSTEGALENIGVVIPWIWAEDEPTLVGGAALHLRRRAVLLRDRVGDLGVAHHVRVLRPRGPGSSTLEQGCAESRALDAPPCRCGTCF